MSTQAEPSSDGVAATTDATSDTVAAATVPTSTPINELPAQIARLIASVPAHVGMVIALPDGTTLYQYNADTLFESASLYKLGVMVEVYRERDAGELTFGDLVTLYPGFFLEDDSVYGYDNNIYDQISVGSLLSNMITLSSNVAATALLHLVGTDQVNSTMESLGLDQTKILWYPSTQIRGSTSVARSGSNTKHAVSTKLISAKAQVDSVPDLVRASVAGAYNVTTPGDMARLFQELVNGTVISPQTSAEMLNLLEKQQINDRLPARLPDGTRVAHKTGDLDNSVHDAGVIYAPLGPIVVVVMSDEVDSRQSVVDLIQEVAQRAFLAESP